MNVFTIKMKIKEEKIRMFSVIETNYVDIIS